MLYLGSTAQVMHAGVVTDAWICIERGIKQDCPSSGSVWALLYGPALRALRIAMLGPWDVFADDIAATMAEVLAHLPALLRVFDALRAAAGPALNLSKTMVAKMAPFWTSCSCPGSSPPMAWPR